MGYRSPANVFSDDLISATELNRQPGRVLDRALEHPVTITRNDHAFALLRREEMANLAKAATLTKTVVEIVNVAYQLSIGKQLGSEHPYGWLRVFDAEELSELVVEVVNVFRLCSDTGEWETMDTVLHEWHESAIATSSPELAVAFNDDIDEVPLTQPK